MTENSLICKIIADADGDRGYWQSILDNDHHGIFIKDEGPLSIFNYGMIANFKDPVIQEARGIIINTETAEVVCWPFRKFAKYDESYADDIDWSTAEVQEKYDGSLIKLWYDKLQDRWRFSTSSMIDASKALMSSYGSCAYMSNFQELIEKAWNYKNIRWDDLNKDYTYLFELVGPGNRVVIHYDNYQLFHIGTRSNITGEEFRTSDTITGIATPTVYRDLQSMEDCEDYIRNVMNVNKNGVYNHCDHEGFVVVDKNWHRNKVKSPIYLQIHSILGNSSIGKQKLIDLLWRNKIDINFISQKHPEVASAFKWYDYQVERFKYEINSIIDVARRIYKLTDGDQKEVALRIKDHRLSYYGFLAIKYPDETAIDFLKKAAPGNVMKCIPDYPKTNFSNMLGGLYQDDIEEEMNEDG